MEFRETLLAAQKNQQQKSSADNVYYKARFDPPKKEQKIKDRLSANIQKFLAKKEEEERQKKLEEQRKREQLQALRDPKELRKIQKTLKTIKSANKSVLADAIDKHNTAVTRDGPDQPDQDDYGYESQEAAALYQKMMQKYSQIPDEPKFSSKTSGARKDINGTLSRVKQALQHVDEPVPHKRRRRTDNGDRDTSPPTKYEPEKKKDDKPEKPKIRKPMPPPIDFNQLLKLAEQKKSEPIEIAVKKTTSDPEPERLMTKRQRREYEEEMARRQRRQARLDDKGKKVSAQNTKPVEKDKKPDTSGFGRIPKVGDKVNGHRIDSPKTHDRNNEKTHDRNSDKTHDRTNDKYDRADKSQIEKERELLERERAILRKERDLLEKEKAERQKLERIDKLKAERDRIEREMERLNKDKEKLEMLTSKMDNLKPTSKSLPQDAKKNIDLKSQNTYRIDKNSNEKKGSSLPVKGASNPKGNVKPSQPLQKGKPELPRNGQMKPQAGPSRAGAVSNTFDFDKHMRDHSISKGSKFPASDVKRKPQGPPKAKRRLDSESEYDSEMDDFIDDEDEKVDYSKHIKDIFGYDRNKYRHVDDEDDRCMESNFAQQQREEYLSKKYGIMEDLEDMRMEAEEKKKIKTKKKRRISDD